MIHGHGGSLHEAALRLGCRPDELTDLSGNLNPLGPPDFVLRHLKDHIGSIAMLPDADGCRVAAAIGKLFGLDGDRILAGNGTTHFIHTLPEVLETKRALVIGPTYADYQDACLNHGVTVDRFEARLEDGFSLDMDALVVACDEVDTVFLCNPNNPTGIRMDPSEIRDLLQACPSTRFVVDETYMSFVDDPIASVAGLCHDNLIVLVSLSKIFRLPGLRIGFLVASGTHMKRMRRLAMPWAVNAVAQEAVLCLARHMEDTRLFVQESRKWLKEERAQIRETLSKTDHFHLIEGDTIFHLIHLTGGLQAGPICAKLEAERILIRDCTNIIGLDNRFIRFSFGPRHVNRALGDFFLDLDHSWSERRKKAMIEE